MSAVGCRIFYVRCRLQDVEYSTSGVGCRTNIFSDVGCWISSLRTCHNDMDCRRFSEVPFFKKFPSDVNLSKVGQSVFHSQLLHKT